MIAAWPMSARALALAVLVCATIASAFSPEATAQVTNIDSASPGMIPGPTALLFIQNVGQFDDRARFQVRGDALRFLTDDALWFTVFAPRRPFVLGREGGQLQDQPDLPPQGANIKLSFTGANAHPRLEGFNRLATHVSYFRGNDPAGWHADVPVWGGVRYRDLYPGIDLELTGSAGRLEPRLIAQSGANLDAVRLRVDGADDLALDGDSLHMAASVGEVVLPLLAVVVPSQELVAKAEPVIAPDDQVIAPFARSSRPEITGSPQAATSLVYGSYLGADDGSDGEFGHAVAVDSTGAAYIVGSTYSSEFPTTPGAYRRHTTSVPETFVTKLSPDGARQIYSTLLAPSQEQKESIVVDATGAAYITGYTTTYTNSTDFPITIGAYDRSPNGGDDMFVVKLNPTGTDLVYSTLLGGSSDDRARGIAIDSAGAAYIVGDTISSNFPTTPGAYDRSYSATICGIPPDTQPCSDAVVVKLNPAGSKLTYATFLGGSASDSASAVAVDRSGVAYITGGTESDNFPTSSNAYDQSFGYPSDAFVVKLNATGSQLPYGSFLGGSEYDTGAGIAIDRNDAIYVTGTTSSPNFPTTPGAFDRDCGSDRACNGSYPGDRREDLFVTKFQVSGTDLVYSTFLGGSEVDTSLGIGVDGGGSATVVAKTLSGDFPTISGAYARAPKGDRDVAIVRLNPGGSAPAYATYLGGSDRDDAYGMAIDGVGGAYVTGETISRDFPTTPNAYKPYCTSCSNVIFVAKVNVGSSGAPRSQGALYLPLLIRMPPGCSDIEQNDDQTQARLLTPLGVACRGSLQDDPVGEDDWYVVNLDRGTTLTIDLSEIPAGANYDLTLFRFDLPGQPRFDSASPGQLPEHIEHHYTAGSEAKAFLRVRKSAAATPPAIDTYTLLVTMN